jgi:hypothetical protein
MYKVGDGELPSDKQMKDEIGQYVYLWVPT